MNISGITIDASPDKAAALQARLTDLSGVEIHAAEENGKMVVTIEDTPDNVPADILMDIQNMQGVLSASLIYNYCDD
jgi:nitrate reductase NapD